MNVLNNKNKLGFVQGLGLALLLAAAARYLSGFPFLSIMGQLVIAILLGIGWRAVVGVPVRAVPGISYAGKVLLRYGIILLGVRLNLVDIVRAGPQVLVIAVINIIFAVFVVYGIARLLKADQRLSMLMACGTAICGAAAVVAISPQIRASDDDTAVSVAGVAVLGTIFTLLYTLLYPVLGLTSSGYGVFAGATLHEVAHVVAAAAPGGKEALDMAIIVKLTRVACLAPAAILIGIWAKRLERSNDGEGRDGSRRAVPVPWFILGFIAMSGLNTLGIFPEALADQLIFAAYLLIGMAMAGLGLNVNIAAFRTAGKSSLIAGLAGSVLLSGLGYLLIWLFGLA